MDLESAIRRNQRLAGVARRILRHTRRNGKGRDDWTHVPDLEPFAGNLSRPEVELHAGIHQKLQQLRRIAPLQVVGGLTTGAGDALFATPWPRAWEALRALMGKVPSGGLLLLYVPHPFWAPLLGEQFAWLPAWNELLAFFDREPGWSVFQYSSSFDAAGRYFFVARKTAACQPLPPASQLARETFRVFYHPGGADLSQGHSSRALSAHLCHALARAGATVYSHDLADMAAVAEAAPGDILIGHVGPWVRAAHQRGLRRIILYLPANRWYETRHSARFEANATIGEQVAMAQMVIAQTGAIWRLTASYPAPEKWRWIDLGVDPHLFPRLKRQFRPAGQRRFCFIHLYDSAQKGADLARAICAARPGYSFSWLGGEPHSARNVRYHAPRPNTSADFRRIVADCDFILTPSREDAQPGTPIEAASLGLLPAQSYTSGYSLSYPWLVQPNDLCHWLDVVDGLQMAPMAELLRAREAFDHYLATFHRWNVVEEQIGLYLREFLQREERARFVG